MSPPEKENKNKCPNINKYNEKTTFEVNPMNQNMCGKLIQTFCAYKDFLCLSEKKAKMLTVTVGPMDGRNGS